MLQGYATQRAFQKFMDSSKECVLIDYRYLNPLENSKSKILKLRIKRLFNYIFNFKKVLIKLKYSKLLNLRNTKFNYFKQNYTYITPTFFQNNIQLKKDPPEFNIYVTGSDQTFSPLINGGYLNTPMFLDFAPTGSKKATYAVSFGTNNISQNDKEILKEKLKEFSIISSRENNGTKLLQELTNKDVKKVLDPTLLLTPKDWNEILIEPKLKQASYILCYFIGEGKYYRKIAKQISSKLDIPLYYIPVNWNDCKKNNNLLFDVGPQEFVGLIKNAALVLTDSFHGTVFSTNFNVPFYTFTKHKGGINSADNSRLYDFLVTYKLDNRIIAEPDDSTPINNEVDFSFFNNLIKEHRSESFNVIKSIINL